MKNINNKYISAAFGFIGLLGWMVKDDDSLLILACTLFIIYEIKCLKEGED